MTLPPPFFNPSISESLHRLLCKPLSTPITLHGNAFSAILVLCPSGSTLCWAFSAFTAGFSGALPRPYLLSEVISHVCPAQPPLF